MALRLCIYCAVRYGPYHMDMESAFTSQVLEGGGTRHEWAGKVEQYVLGLGDVGNIFSSSVNKT